jgi:hypothetical protein
MQIRSRWRSLGIWTAVATLSCSAVAIAVSIADVRFFSEGIEAAGDPATATALKDGVSDADALIIFTPEYNRSVPGVAENAVDWLSRRFMAGSRAQLTGSPGMATSAGWLTIFVSFLANSLAELIDGRRWLARVSPWSWHGAGEALTDDFNAANFGLLVLAVIVVGGAAIAAFERRDLHL